MTTPLTSILCALTLTAAPLPALANDILDVQTVLSIFSIATPDPTVIIDALDTATQGAMDVTLIPASTPADSTFLSVFLNTPADPDDPDGPSEPYGVATCTWSPQPLTEADVRQSIVFGMTGLIHLTAPFDPGTAQRLSCQYAPFMVHQSRAQSAMAVARTWATTKIAPVQSDPNPVFAQSDLAVAADKRPSGTIWMMQAAMTHAVPTPAAPKGDHVGFSLWTILDVPGPAPDS